MSDTILRCPRDHVDLEFEGYWKHPRHRCGICGGCVLDQAEIVQALGEPGCAKLTSANVEAAMLPASGLACPRDGSPLRTLVHDDVELGLCETCASVWVEKEEFQKLAAKGKANAEAMAEAAAVDPVDYVAKMDKRLWISSRFFMPPAIVGFVGLTFIGGTCGGNWEAWDPYQPWATILVFCAFGGALGYLMMQRCTKCEKLFEDNDGISLVVPDYCPHCGTQLR